MANTTSYFKFYDKGIKNLVTAENLLTDDIKVILLSSSYTPNTATHEFYDVSITNELITANGYTAGGQSLTTKSLTASGTAGEYIFSSDDPVWTVVTGNLTAFYWAMYNNTPASSKPLIGYGHMNYNGGSPLAVTQSPGFNLTLLLGASGWFKPKKVDGV